MSNPFYKQRTNSISWNVRICYFQPAVKTPRYDPAEVSKEIISVSCRMDFLWGAPVGGFFPFIFSFKPDKSNFHRKGTWQALPISQARLRMCGTWLLQLRRTWHLDLTSGGVTEPPVCREYNEKSTRILLLRNVQKNFCKSLSPVLGTNKNISWCDSITFVLESIFSFRKGLLAGQKIFHCALVEVVTIRVWSLLIFDEPFVDKFAGGPDPADRCLWCTWQVESSRKSRNLFPDNFLCIWGQSLMSIKTRKITSQQFGISVFVFQWLKQMHWKEDSLRITTTNMRSEISSLLQYMSLRSVS